MRIVLKDRSDQKPTVYFVRGGGIVLIDHGCGMIAYHEKAIATP